ncbi:MAG TPA: hypothetical protein PLQ04_01390 [Lachnospiraceae bacterium]|nr:hypothetical protein [Lachnospiraceae bacterium]
MADQLKRYYLVRFSKKTGAIDTTLTGLGNGMLQLWALQNLTAKSKDAVIFDEDGKLHSYYKGTGDFPGVTKYGPESTLCADDICPGLLDAVKDG